MIISPDFALTAKRIYGFKIWLYIDCLETYRTYILKGCPHIALEKGYVLE